MSDDFYGMAARQRLEQIQASRARSLADLAEAKSMSDYDGAAGAVQTLANLDAEASNLAQLHSRYVQSQNPPAPPEPTPEERAARRFDRMDYRDVLDLARTSRHAKDLTWDDPGMLAGLAEARQRRGRGE